MDWNQRRNVQSCKSSSSRIRIAASKNYLIAHQTQLCDRTYQILKADAKQTRKRKRKAYLDHFNDKVKSFLVGIEGESPLSQITKTPFYKEIQTESHI